MLAPLDIRQIVILFKTGDQIPDIADTFEASHTTVRSILEEFEQWSDAIAKKYGYKKDCKD